MIQPKWISVKDKLPKEYQYHFLRCIYPNGNEVQAIGSIIKGVWEIHWSDDHPSAEDVAYWLKY